MQDIIDLGSRIKWHYEYGKQIIMVDFSGLTDKLVLDLIQLSYQKIKNNGKKICTLSVMSGAKANSRILRAFKVNGKRMDSLIEKRAIVDITPIQMILLNAILKYTGQKNKTQIFKTVDSALQWLSVG